MTRRKNSSRFSIRTLIALLSCLMSASAVSSDDYFVELCDSLESAARAGDPRSQADYASCFIRGIGRERDYEEGEKWLAEALGSGHAAASVTWSSVVLFRLSDETKYEKAIENLMTSTCQGSPQAEFALYLVHKNGIGVPVDDVLSQFYLERAAVSLHLLARFAMFGEYVLEDPSDAQRNAAEYWKNRLMELIATSGGGSVEEFKLKAMEDELIVAYMFSESDLAKILAEL